MKTILVANLAGGVAKSTSVQALATAFAEYGKSVLAIDADPGTYLTFLCGIENPRFSTRELFNRESSLEMTAVKTYDRFSLIPGAVRLGNWQPESLDHLRDGLSEFDVVIIDSATGPNRILAELIQIADLIIAPVTRDFHSIRGLLNLRDFAARENSAAKISVIDIALSDWNPDLRFLVSDDFKILEPAISRLSEEFTQVSGRSLLSELPNSQTASDYRELAYSLLEEFGLF